jgi:predicted N-acetyltransferase YhbS
MGVVTAQESSRGSGLGHALTRRAIQMLHLVEKYATFVS